MPRACSITAAASVAAAAASDARALAHNHIAIADQPQRLLLEAPGLLVAKKRNPAINLSMVQGSVRKPCLSRLNATGTGSAQHPAQLDRTDSSSSPARSHKVA